MTEDMVKAMLDTLVPMDIDSMLSPKDIDAMRESRDSARRIAMNIAEERDAYRASLEAATKRVEELEAALTAAIAHCKEATVSPAGRHVVEQAIMEMSAALAGKGE